MVDIVTRINNVVNGFVWGPFGLALLFCTGLWLSIRTGFFQFRRMGYWLRHTIGAIFTNKDVTAHTSKEDMAISQFQSMCTALAGTIGTGNIVGVATAIVSGGPGAIFWMWVMALLGMMTSFAENVLGVYYRRRNEKGEWSGGAMYYLTDGLGAKPGCKCRLQHIAGRPGVFTDEHRGFSAQLTGQNFGCRLADRERQLVG